LSKTQIALFLTFVCREAFQFLKLSNRTDLETKLTSLLEELRGLHPFQEFVAKLQQIQERLHQLDTEEERAAGSNGSKYRRGCTNWILRRREQQVVMVVSTGEAAPTGY
jgi:hypothetical protein